MWLLKMKSMKENKPETFICKKKKKKKKKKKNAVIKISTLT